MLHSQQSFLVILTLIFFLLTLQIEAFQITGARGGINQTTGERPIRQEINSFSKSGPAFDLFVLALRRFQSTNQSDPLSYFQIAGIHGYPTLPWDNVVGTNGENYPGFCMHASVNFPTWHRPYLALYEQLIVQHAQMIARSFPQSQRATYLNASLVLRIPYWDWIVYPDLPDVVTSPLILVNTPEGLQKIENPLYQYRFQSDAAGNGFPTWHPMAKFSTTVRHPSSETGESNHTRASLAMRATAPSVLGQVYQLFTTVTNYTQFSCTANNGERSSANNLEYIHNAIHDNVGGNNGHMTYPEVSSFDPIFFLHHANVDRLFAMWQALNPESYVVSMPNTLGTYYEPVGTLNSVNSSLAPFHYDNGTSLYTSNLVRDTKVFGYTYPDLIDWNVSATELASTTRTRINQLYNPNVTAEKGILKHRDASHMPDFARLDVNNLDVQWSIRLRINRFATKEPFRIHFFDGKPPKDASGWSTAPNLIATHPHFVPYNMSTLGEQHLINVQLQGELSITHTLALALYRGVLADLSVKIVLPFLADKLQWRARSHCGKEIDTITLSGLEIMVISRNLRAQESISDFPAYDRVEEHPELTVRRDGKGGTNCCPDNAT